MFVSKGGSDLVEETLGCYDVYVPGRSIEQGEFSNVSVVTRNGQQYAMKSYPPTSCGGTIRGPSHQTVTAIGKGFDETVGKWSSMFDLDPDAVICPLDHGLDPFPWVVMELADCDFGDVMDAGDASVDDVVNLLYALSKIHSSGMVHLNMKPGNILLVDGKWKFSDPGDPSKVDQRTDSPSSFGSVRGMNQYLAPEQIVPDGSGPLDVRTDIWHMGILAYNVIVGRPPYQFDNPIALRMAIPGRGPDLDTVPERYRPVLSRALAKERRDRYSSAEEFAKELFSAEVADISRRTSERDVTAPTGGSVECPAHPETTGVPDSHVPLDEGSVGVPPRSHGGIIHCPACGRRVPIGPGLTFCSACGKDLGAVCPACNTPQQPGEFRCRNCGLDFREDLKRAIHLEMHFEAELREGRLAEAEEDLAQLEGSHPYRPGLDGLREELTRARTMVASMTEGIHDSYRGRKYYDVKTATEALMEKFPEILNVDPELRRWYEEAGRHYCTAEMLCRKAIEADILDERMGFYHNAFKICPDHPEAGRRLREHPPRGPTDSKGIYSESDIILEFGPPAEMVPTSYCIFREVGSFPHGITDDSPPFAEVASTSFRDKDVEPGVEYYYSVYSKRWGILSKEGAHIGPMIYLPDVEVVSIIPLDEGLRITFEKPRGCTRVRLYRSVEPEDGTGVEIILNGKTTYDDMGLDSGRKYYYLFVAEYGTDDHVERSSGVLYSAVPGRFPSPVKDLSVKWNKSDGSYTASWSTTEHVDLYVTLKKVLIPQRLEKTDPVLSQLTRIEPIERYPNGARFHLSDDHVHYIYPIIPHGRWIVKGYEMMIANLRPFENVEAHVDGNICIVTLGWFQGIAEAKIVVSDDGYRDLDDPCAMIHSFDRRLFETEEAITIPMGDSKRKYLNLFALYDLDGEMKASRGIPLEVRILQPERREIAYEFTAGPGGMYVSLTTDGSVPSLPQVVMVRTAEGIPLKKTDGGVIWKSDSSIGLDGGRCSFFIPNMTKDDIKRTRLFFERIDDHYDYVFIHPI